jgi:hypothetical protein
MNARGNSQLRALAIHSPVRTAPTPAVCSDFAKVLSNVVKKASWLLLALFQTIDCGGEPVSWR